MKVAQAEVIPGAWKLADNPVWNVPADKDQVHFDTVTVGPWQVIKTIRALVIDLDGQIYGVRTMGGIDPHGGYTAFGRVSIGGKKVKGFTSSQLFEREDGSLCDVAVIII